MDLFANPQPRHGHPNILLIGDMMRHVSKPEMKRRHQAGEYRGAHPAYLAEAGIPEASK